MKKLYMKTLFTAAFGLIVLNGCGGGGTTESTVGSTSTTSVAENTTNEGSTVTVVEIPQCQDTLDYTNDTQTIDVTNKNITSVDGDAEVRLWLSPDGSESACMISGTATLL